MYIAIIVPSLTRSATITVALSIAEGLIGKGHSVDVFYFDEKIERNIPIGCCVFRIGFFEKIDFSKYDVIHSHNLRPDLFVAINRSRIRGVCISTIHNFVRDELQNYHGKFAAFIFTLIWSSAWKRFDHLVCLNKVAVNYYKKLIKVSMVSYVHNGVSISDKTKIQIDARVFEAADSFRAKGLFLIGTYCNQTKGKGLDQIIRLLSLESSIAAIIIGNGPEHDSLVALASELGVESRCLFYQYLPSAYVYNECFNAYIIPSRSEGFGIGLVEAALSGVNIMCSDINTFREMFDESEVSFFNLDDTKSMREIIISFRGGVDKRIFAKNKAQQFFSIEAMTNRYLEIYNQALGRS